MTRDDFEFGRVRAPLLDAHRGDRADAANIQRACLRFSWARRKAPTRAYFMRWLVAGFAIGVGAASAASLAPRFAVRSAAPSEAVQIGSGQAKHPAVSRAARSRVAQAEPALSYPSPIVPAGPLRALPSQSAASSPSGAPRSPVPANTVAKASGSASVSGPASANASEWGRAAQALRTGDLGSAEAALANLEKSDSIQDRQAAELARAQLLVKQSRAAEAIGTLQRLAREGLSPVIVAQAASALKNLGDKRFAPLARGTHSHQ